MHLLKLLERKNPVNLENKMPLKELLLTEKQTINLVKVNLLSKLCLSPRMIKLKHKLYFLKELLSQKEMLRTGTRSSVSWSFILLKLPFQISRQADNKNTLRLCKVSPKKNSRTQWSIKLAGTISLT